MEGGRVLPFRRVGLIYSKKGALDPRNGAPPARGALVRLGGEGARVERIESELGWGRREWGPDPSPDDAAVPSPVDVGGPPWLCPALRAPVFLFSLRG